VRERKEEVPDGEISGAFKVEVVGPLNNLGGGRSGSMKSTMQSTPGCLDRGPKNVRTAQPTRIPGGSKHVRGRTSEICGRGAVSQQEINLEMVLEGEKTVEKAFVTEKKQPPGFALEENLDTRWASKARSIKPSSSLDPNLRFLYGSRTSGTRLW
jgi:hypothetical protein